MSYEFTKLGAVEALTEMPENANALVEVDGAIKRVPAGDMGGGVKIVNATADTSDMQTFSNVSKDKSFNELKEAYDDGQLLWCRITMNVTLDGVLQTVTGEAPLMAFSERGGVQGFMFSIAYSNPVITILSDDSISVAID